MIIPISRKIPMAVFNLKLKFFIYCLFCNILINAYIINIHGIRENSSQIRILWPCPTKKPPNKFFIIFVKLKLKLSFNVFIKVFPFHFPFAVMWKLIRYTHFCNSSKKTSITRQIYRQPGILVIMPVQ